MVNQRRAFYWDVYPPKTGILLRCVSYIIHVQAPERNQNKNAHELIVLDMHFKKLK